MNEAGNRTVYRQAGGRSRRCSTGSICRASTRCIPPGIVEWGTTPKDFFERKAAMMWTTTGNLTNVRRTTRSSTSASRCCPRSKRRGSPTGGGNFYIFKKATPAQQEAAFKFIKWITTPERAAQWSIDTGYVAVRPDACDTPAMKKYVAEFPPAAVARDQLQYRRRRVVDAREPARHQGAERRPAGGAHRHQDAGAGDEGCAGARPSGYCCKLARAAEQRSAAQHAPSRCRALQAEGPCTRLACAAVHGWLLLLPATALLALFTH